MVLEKALCFVCLVGCYVQTVEPLNFALMVPLWLRRCKQRGLLRHG